MLIIADILAELENPRFDIRKYGYRMEKEARNRLIFIRVSTRLV